MKQFAQLIKTLDGTNKTNVKVEALSQYFKAANDEDKVWTIAILSHRRPPRPSGCGSNKRGCRGS